MRKIKDIPWYHMAIIYNAVNVNSSGQTISEEKKEKMRSLYMKVIEGVKWNHEGNYDFKEVDHRELVLEDTEWMDMREAIRDLKYPTMFMELEKEKILSVIDKAEETKK